MSQSKRMTEARKAKVKAEEMTYVANQAAGVYTEKFSRDEAIGRLMEDLGWTQKRATAEFDRVYDSMVNQEDPFSRVV